MTYRLIPLPFAPTVRARIQLTFFLQRSFSKMTDSSTQQQTTPNAEVSQPGVNSESPLPVGGLARSETSTSTLLTREQQLKEEIDRLKREEQALQQKDEIIKKNIDSLREQKVAAAIAQDQE